jgi:hypothetical protein
MIVVRSAASVIVAGVASSVFLIGCPDPREVAGVGLPGCQREISGVTAVTRPETSKLSCYAINDLVSSIPSEPENYLMGSDSPRLFWKCRFNGVGEHPVILKCRHDERHFTIVKKTR